MKDFMSLAILRSVVHELIEKALKANKVRRRMFITPAFAQSTSVSDPMGGLGLILPMLIMVGIFYFLLIRPQQQRQKEHRELVNNVRRGDTVVTAGGFVGKVIKVFDNTDDVEIELNDQMKIRVVRSTLMDVRSKGEPVKS